MLPATDLAAEVARRSRNTARKRAFNARRTEPSELWAADVPRVVPVAALDTPSLAAQRPSDEDRAQVGAATLAAFFRVVLEGGNVFLDLRPSRLAWTGAELRWSPGRLWSSWDDEFSRQVAGLYRGLYRDDDALFDRSLRGLGLSRAQTVLRTHFGGDDQTAVAFKLETFHTTFHEVFVSCRDNDASLHRGFVTLGLLLACLYETLELLGGTFDIRAAFEQGTQQSVA